jgi:hypothetical protein
MPSLPPGFDPASVEKRLEAWRKIQGAQLHREGFTAFHLYDEDGSDGCHAFLQPSWATLRSSAAA